jgi:hypothetical protein
MFYVLLYKGVTFVFVGYHASLSHSPFVRRADTVIGPCQYPNLQAKLHMASKHMI